MNEILKYLNLKEVATNSTCQVICILLNILDRLRGRSAAWLQAPCSLRCLGAPRGGLNRAEYWSYKCSRASDAPQWLKDAARRLYSLARR